MSRRSMRLLTSGYYRDDGEMNDESSSSHHVSYRESPVRVFQRRTGSRKQTLSRTGSQVSTPALSRTGSQEAAPSLSFSSLPSDVLSALRASTQRQSQHVSPASRFSAPSTARPLLEQSCTTSGYSSSEGGEAAWAPKRSRLLSRSQRNSSSRMFSGDAESVDTSFIRVLLAGLALLCCNLFGLLRDVLLLSSCGQLLRKPALTVLTLTLIATGFWLWYPAPTSVLNVAEPAWAGYSTTVLGINTDSRIVTDFNVFRKEVLDRINQGEAKWKDSWTRELDDVKREIGRLQKDAERHRHMSEMLTADITHFKDAATNNNLDQQAWVTEEVTGVANKVADLKDSVSYLRTVQRNLEQRLGAQEYTNDQLKKELTDWLKRELRAGLGHGTGSVVLRPELQEALEALEKRLLQSVTEVAQKEHSDLWGTVGESLQREGLGAITVKDVHEIVQRALSLYKADGTGMADYALESLGAGVIGSQCSETYRTRSPCYSLFGVPLWYASESPRTVIQPEMHPGKCWAFKGSEGFLTIALSLPVRVTHVTLEHIPKSLSPTGRIDSAPREFAVYGLSGFDNQEEGEFLGRFTYDSDGEPIQTFELPESVKDVYRAVQLRVLSNWGNPEYSCVYRFRVHGQPLPH
ncbi:SUN domain-containing protein 2-like [Sardina pilchardus]|uniref:SUN domain-containing protein 2-like n=1 Tax=Sardina pilchardus TaxID=27697 RepID=UPI002E162893